MVNGREGQSPALRMHNLLLALAGRIDDSALGDARRLSVQARLDEAAELVAGTLVAGRIPLLPGEKATLVGLINGTGSDADYVQRVAVVNGDGAAAAGAVAHRFSADGAPDADVREAVAPVLELLPGIRAVHAVWRNTVAGSVPGPMPQRVVLVEVGADGSAPATAFRVEAALHRAGIAAAVEVSGPDSGWMAYQEQALRAAVRIDTDGTPVEPDHADPAPVEATLEEPVPDEPVPGEAVSAESPDTEPPTVVTAPVPEPEPEPEQKAFEPPTVKYPVGAAIATEARTEVVADAEGDPTGAAGDIAPGELFWPQAEAQKPHPATDGQPSAESTGELSRSAVRRLRDRLFTERQAAEASGNGQTAQERPVETEDSGEPVEVPAPADPHLSDRDRMLLRELHEELAKRERDQAAQVQLNGWEFPNP